MKASEMREKTNDELDQELRALLREQFNLRMQNSVSQISRHDQFSKVRKDIARIKTILNERKLAGTTL